MNSPMLIKPLSRQDILTHIDALNDILVNCVNGGASVSFIQPFSAGKPIPSGSASQRASGATSVPFWAVLMRSRGWLARSS